jgi:hypothetical protein
MKIKIVTPQMSALLLVLLAVLPIGCSSTNRQAAGSTPVHQTGYGGLKVGMTYFDVARTLRPVDPEIGESIKDILEQERAATKEYKRAVAELRAAGLQTTPKLNSQITVDGCDYILNFEDRKLVSWALR